MAEPPPAHAYPFFKYNIIFFYISQVTALISPLDASAARTDWHIVLWVWRKRSECQKMWGGGPYDTLETTCHVFNQINRLKIEDRLAYATPV